MRNLVLPGGRRLRSVGILLAALASSIASTASLAQTAPTAGLVGYWNFDEASGNSALDRSGTNNNGTLSGAGVTRTAGKVGSGALNFDGASGKVTIPGTASLNLTSSFTLTAWLRPTAFTAYQTAVVKGSSSACAYWLQTVGVHPSTGFGTSATCSSYREHIAATSLQANTWYHVAAVFDDAANRVTYYIGGASVYSATESSAPSSSSTSEALVVGQSTYAGGNFERWRGGIDELRVYNRPLSAQEVVDVFNDTGSTGPPDLQAPTAPTNIIAAVASTSQINLSWSSSTDNVGVAGYRVYRDGNWVGSAVSTTYPDTGLAAGSTHYYAIAAYDSAQNLSSQSTPVVFATTLANDVTPPTVSLTAPSAGTTVKGAAVSLSASAADAVGVVGVQFLLDGNALGAEDTSAPFGVSWATTASPDGSHVLAARARDAAGNSATSAPVSVTVDNTAPTTPTGVSAAAVSSAQINVSWSPSSDTVGVAGYRIYRGGSLVGTTLASSYADTGLLPSSTYSYTVSAFDNAQNASLESSPAAVAITWASGPAGDTTSPTVGLSAPAPNAVVRGTAISVAATAADNVGVAGVLFLLDGVAIGAEDTSSPYSISWNSNGAADGGHSLAARARDAAGNAATSSAVPVRVDNLPPTGTISINNGASATNSRTVSLSLSASDVGTAVAQMRFSNGGSYSSAESFATSKTWTLSSGNGTKTVSVQFRDTTGNWSSGTSDTILYDSTAPTISSVSATNVTATGAAIAWTTNEPATSQVEYGPTTSYGQTTGVDGGLVAAHAMSLSGLTPNTTYNYRARSRDAAGNERVGSNGTFRTLNISDTEAPSTPAGVSAAAVSSSQINVSWSASTDNVGVVSYAVFRDGSQIATTSGLSYPDFGRTPSTTYGYAVQAVDGAGNRSALSAPEAVATTPAPEAGAFVYPLRLSANGQYLEDQNSKPFFINGDTAWSLIVELDQQEADTYLADRQAKGFDLVLANLIEHEFGTNAPANIFGVPPFSPAGNFEAPNEAYFAHADWIINRAAERGIVVLLDPLYLGYACGGEGWCAEVQASSLARMRAWGRYVGNRYKDVPNIIWLVGADADPSAYNVAGKVREFVAGLREYDQSHLITAHNAPEQSSRDVWEGEPWLGLNSVYTRPPTYVKASAEYNKLPFMPAYLIEGRYENEQGASSQLLRSQAYGAVLAGATAGHVFGNCPIWNFASTTAFCSGINWVQQLNSVGSRTLAYVGTLFRSRAFQSLIPDSAHSVLTAGYESGSTYATAARASDGSSVIAYLPTSRTVTVDLRRVGGALARVWWFNPSTGQATFGGDFPTSSTQQFTPPAGGDWVLVIDNQALGLAAPGS